MPSMLGKRMSVKDCSVQNLTSELDEIEPNDESQYGFNIKAYESSFPKKKYVKYYGQLC